MTATIQARSTRQPAFINTGSAGALRAASLHRPRRGEPQAEITIGWRHAGIPREDAFDVEPLQRIDRARRAQRLGGLSKVS